MSIRINGRAVHVPEGHYISVGNGRTHIMPMPPGPQSVKQTPDGRLKVGMRVRLTRQGFKACKPNTPEQARAAMEGSVITGIEGPMTSGLKPLYAIDLDGPLSVYLLNSEDVEPA